MKHKIIILKNGEVLDEFYSTLVPEKDDILAHMSKRYKVVSREVNFTTHTLKLTVIEQ